MVEPLLNFFGMLLLLVMIFCGTDLRFLLLELDADDVTAEAVLWSSINETMWVDVAERPVGLVELLESWVPFSHELNRWKWETLKLVSCAFSTWSTGQWWVNTSNSHHCPHRRLLLHHCSDCCCYRQNHLPRRSAEPAQMMIADSLD